MEHIIINNLMCSSKYINKVIPYLKKEYFNTKVDQVLFEEIKKFYEEYQTLINKDILEHNVTKRKDISQEEYTAICENIRNFSGVPETENYKWLVEETNKFCTLKACINVLFKGSKLLDEKKDMSGIAQMFIEATSIKFEDDLKDYFDDALERIRVVKDKSNKIPTGIASFDDITCGGLDRATYNVCIAGTNVGKTLWLCNLATNLLKTGHNVLYITLEISKLNIGKRIDANLLNIPIKQLEDCDEDKFLSRIKEMRTKLTGNLDIKHYPASSINANHIKSIIKEIERVKGYKIDALCVDYLNLMLPIGDYVKGDSDYNKFGAISNNLVNLAHTLNIAVNTATQTKREANSKTALSVQLDDIASSFRIAHEADLVFSLAVTPELERVGQVRFEVLKTRYNDNTYNRVFNMSMNKMFMRVSDIEQQQLAINNDNSIKKFYLENREAPKKIMFN